MKYALPVVSSVRRKARDLEKKLKSEKDRIANYREDITKLRRQISKVSPSDRSYVTRIRIPELEKRIKGVEERLQDQPRELRLALAAEQRVVR